MEDYLVLIVISASSMSKGKFKNQIPCFLSRTPVSFKKENKTI